MFGTDGIRDRVGTGLITPENLVHLGSAIGSTISPKSGKPTVLIAKDTRVSGYMIESALEAGLSFTGTDILLVGPLPTAALAILTQEAGADFGIMISASHNQYHDNGIKIFYGNGSKISLETEKAIAKNFTEKPYLNKPINSLGKAQRLPHAATRYMSHCTTKLPRGKPLKGLKVVIDCANGAGYNIAPMILKDLGAEVITINAEPDGYNINAKCGSTDLNSLLHATKQHNADCGLALDGDADRVIMVDKNQIIYDGDDILYILACNPSSRNKATDGVVGTTMSNSGLAVALAKKDINFYRAQVGDRFVANELTKRQWILGGEPSGHIISSGHSETGDGIFAGILVMHTMLEQKQTLAELTTGFVKWPQTQINIPVQAANQPLKPEWNDLIEQYQQKSNARIILRASGTEPCIRLMVEAMDADNVKELCKSIAEKITLD